MSIALTASDKAHLPWDAPAGLIRSIGDVLTDGILVTSDRGEVLDVNPAALRIFGLEHADVGQAGWWERMKPAEVSGMPLNAASHIGPRVLQTGVLELDVRLRITRPDGGQRCLSLNYLPFDGSPRALVISFRNITEQRGAEEELRRFAAVVELSTDFIAMADLDLKVLYVNEAGRRLVGLESIEAARETRIMDFLPEERRRTMREPSDGP